MTTGRPARSSLAPGPEARIESILAAAAIEFSHKGYAATSMRDVADRSGASIGSIYYHFENKEDLLRALLCDNFRRVLDSLGKALDGIDDPEEALAAFVSNHVRFFARRLPEMRVMSHELDTLSPETGQEAVALRRKYSRAAIEILRGLRPDLEGDELRIHSLCLFGMLNWTYRWFHTVSPDLGADGVARRMTEVFLHGFGNGRGS